MNQEALLNQIYGAIVSPARWPEVLVSVSDHIDGLGGMLVYNAPSGGKNLIVLGRLDPEYTAVFHKYHVWNPWTLAVKQQPFDRPIISGSLVDRRIIQGTAFYADVLAPQRIQDMAVISHRALAHNGGVGGFGFALSAKGADRADLARQKLGRLTVHLCRALDATLRLGPMVDGSRQLERVLQLMPNAALLLDAKGRVVHANSAAERLLSEGDGLTCGTDGAFQLSAVLRNENAALKHVLATALSVADGSSDELAEPLRLTRPLNSTPLLVVPIPLPPPAFQLWELSQSARVLVLIIDPTTRNLAAASALQATYGLTNAEARVATLVGSGLNGPQAAQDLHISPATVKTHLARCFAKMGIRSQVELARTLSGFPAYYNLNGMNEQ